MILSNERAVRQVAAFQLFARSSHRRNCARCGLRIGSIARRYSSTVKCADSTRSPFADNLIRLLQLISISSASTSFLGLSDDAWSSMDTASQTCCMVNGRVSGVWWIIQSRDLWTRPHATLPRLCARSSIRSYVDSRVRGNRFSADNLSSSVVRSQRWSN